MWRLLALAAPLLLAGCGVFENDAAQSLAQTGHWNTPATFTTGDVRIVTERTSPHSSPHFTIARADAKTAAFATAALNACMSGASLCSGMFGMGS